MIFEQFIWIILEFVEKGDLKTLLTSGKLEKFGEQEKLKVSLDLAKGLEHLHRLRVIHRDLAARNLLVDKSMTVKISGTFVSEEVNVIFS
jgi:serine/threonine protein kinase